MDHQVNCKSSINLPWYFKVWINFSTDPQWKAVTPLGNTVLAQLSKECLNLIQQLVLQFTVRKHQHLSGILLFLDYNSSPCMGNLLVSATNSREALDLHPTGHRRALVPYKSSPPSLPQQISTAASQRVRKAQTHEPFLGQPSLLPGMNRTFLVENYIYIMLALTANNLDCHEFVESYLWICFLLYSNLYLI